MQRRQSDWKVDRQIGEGVDSNAHAPRMHLAGRYRDDVALACEAFRSSTPERSRSAEHQSERVGVVAVPRESLRLVSRPQHFNLPAESRPYSHNPSLIQCRHLREYPSFRGFHLARRMTTRKADLARKHPHGQFRERDQADGCCCTVDDHRER